MQRIKQFLVFSILIKLISITALNSTFAISFNDESASSTTSENELACIDALTSLAKALDIQSIDKTFLSRITMDPLSVFQELSNIDIKDRLTIYGFLIQNHPEKMRIFCDSVLFQHGPQIYNFIREIFALAGSPLVPFDVKLWIAENLVFGKDGHFYRSKMNGVGWRSAFDFTSKLSAEEKRGILKTWHDRNSNNISDFSHFYLLVGAPEFQSPSFAYTNQDRIWSTLGRKPWWKDQSMIELGFNNIKRITTHQGIQTDYDYMIQSLDDWGSEDPEAARIFIDRIVNEVIPISNRAKNDFSIFINAENFVKNANPNFSGRILIANIERMKALGQQPKEYQIIEIHKLRAENQELYDKIMGILHPHPTP